MCNLCEQDFDFRKIIITESGIDGRQTIAFPGQLIDLDDEERFKERFIYCPKCGRKLTLDCFQRRYT